MRTNDEFTSQHNITLNAIKELVLLEIIGLKYS